MAAGVVAHQQLPVVAHRQSWPSCKTRRLSAALASDEQLPLRANTRRGRVHAKGVAHVDDLLWATTVQGHLLDAGATPSERP